MDSAKLEKLRSRGDNVQIGGKGTVRRKKKVMHKSAGTDEKKLQSSLKKLGVSSIPNIEEVDPEFETILSIVDPNRDGYVTLLLLEFMAFMISRETENVQSRHEVEEAFRALTKEGRAFITKDEIHTNLSKDQAQYCIRNMPPYYDSAGHQVADAYDYQAFTRQLFQN